MYSIIQLCDKGYKVRYASNNLEEIYKNYEVLDSIDKCNEKNKLLIVDNIKNQFISFEQLKVLIGI